MKVPEKQMKVGDISFMKEDYELIEMFFSRSDEAISHTADKYNNYCYSIAYGILKSHEDSEECVNDTFMNAWNSIPPKRPDKLSSFLGRITRNNALNIYEKNHAAKRGKGQVGIALSELAECVDMNSSIESENERKEIREVLNAFLRSQNEQRRNIFIQRYWYLLSIKEIAFQQDMNQNQIKSVLYQMRNELKKRLQKEELF